MDRKNNNLVKRISPFWIINITGWGVLFLIQLFLYYYQDLSEPNITIGFLLTKLTGFISSIFLRHIYRRINNYSKSLVKLAIQILVISLIMSQIWFILDFIVSIPLQGFNELLGFYNLNYYLRSIWSGFYTLILWSTLYFVIKFWLEWKTQKEQTEKAVLLAQSAQLQMLRYQVNPHFLFNSLSSLRALVRDDQKQAEKMILQISKFLRYSLIEKKNNQVKLKDEVEALKHYFEIERVRFGNKLLTEIKIDRNTEDVKIPSFLLHPIIENAIKYGMDTSPMPLQIKLLASFQDNTLTIDVINSGNWINENRNRLGTGIGLKNVKQRLNLAYTDNYSMEIFKNSNAVHVQIKMNIEE